MKRLTKKERLIARLTEARRLIRDVGFCKGRLQKEKNGVVVGYCVMGALQASGRRGMAHVGREVRNAVESALPEGVRMATDLNDARRTKKADILNLFTRAIRKLKK